MRAKDVVVLGLMLWWLLHDREETSVNLSQTCVFNDGSVMLVPLGAECPNGSVLETQGNVYPTEP